MRILASKRAPVVVMLCMKAEGHGFLNCGMRTTAGTLSTIYDYVALRKNMKCKEGKNSFKNKT